ncbi:MAG: type I restriction enzyme HsdR N-terminal domain-containing protein [Bacteroidota bacterium]
MIRIEYPPYQPKIKQENEKEFIFDEVRKQWVILTPEEWVRQNFLQYLIQVKKYPASLIAVEKEIKLGDIKKRFDIVVYDKDTKPAMIVECKEMNVPLTESVLHQGLRYNQVLKVPFLIITNGSNTFAYSMENNELKELLELPGWNTDKTDITD